jgi:hypothetical protein
MINTALKKRDKKSSFSPTATRNSHFSFANLLQNKPRGELAFGETLVRMDGYTTAESHPYGVLPSGNAYFASSELLSVRSQGLGHFSPFSDEVINEFLEFVDAVSLVAFIRCSRIVSIMSKIAVLTLLLL